MLHLLLKLSHSALYRFTLGSPKDPKLAKHAQKWPKIHFLVHHPKFLLASCVDTQIFLASNIEQMAPRWPQGPELDQKCPKMA